MHCMAALAVKHSPTASALGRLIQNGHPKPEADGNDKLLGADYVACGRAEHPQPGMVGARVTEVFQQVHAWPVMPLLEAGVDGVNADPGRQVA